MHLLLLFDIVDEPVEVAECLIVDAQTAVEPAAQAAIILNAGIVLPAVYVGKLVAAVELRAVIVVDLGVDQRSAQRHAQFAGKARGEIAFDAIMVSVLDRQDALRRRRGIPPIELNVLLVGIEARDVELQPAVEQRQLAADLIGIGSLRVVLAREDKRFGIEATAAEAAGLVGLTILQLGLIDILLGFAWVDNFSAWVDRYSAWVCLG